MNNSYVIAPIPESMARQALDLAKSLKQDSPYRYKHLVADVLSDLTKINLEYYFLRPIELFKLGSFSEKVANMAIHVAYSAITRFVKRGIEKLSDDQLIILADLIEECVFLNKEDIP
ncbi:MAG: hypothetical protein HQK79_21870 [Desulfobacterales bacterium]|nr:hypothetical protein [Desulfobacterales bacterium]